METGGGTRLKAFSWNLQYLNTIKTIQTSRNSENFIVETPCAILDGPHRSTVHWWQSFSDWNLLNQNSCWSLSQALIPLVQHCPASPVPWATHSAQQPYSFSLLQFDFLSTPASITSVCTGQTIPEQGAQPLFSSLTSSMVPKGPGLRVWDQENGNIHQMYKCKVSTQII